MKCESHRINACVIACMAAASIACAAALFQSTEHRAFADDVEISELQAQVEASAQAYDAAQARAEELQAQVSQNQVRIDEISAQLPGQQARAASAIRALYLLQQDAYGLLQALLGSNSLSDFLKTFDYIDHIHARNAAQVEELARMSDELEAKRIQLEYDLQEADQQASNASRALATAQEARKAAQRKAEQEAAEQARAQQQAAARAAAQEEQAKREAAKAQESAREAALREEQARAAAEKDAADKEAAKRAREAAEEAAATEQAAAAAAAAEQAPSSTGGVDAANTQSSVVAEEPEDTVSGSIEPGQVNWDDPKAAFVGEWAGRIDAYLAGSPLAGRGSTFAQAAWDYGVDPRWSPAIAYVESSLGAACFLPHNAWGWGSESWGDWDEAIRDHVAGLARGYGSTITYAAAKKYCPPNANHWYNVCLAQMDSI